jgi:hypothetical protein
MANCNKCAYSSEYWDVRAQTNRIHCLSPHDKSMVTKEGEHDCPAFKVNEWDEKRIDIIGSNSNDGLHYKDIDNGNS